MSVFRGSRYVTGVQLGFDFSDGKGSRRTILHREVLDRAALDERDYVVHQVVDGDLLDGIVAQVGGREDLYWLVADLNDLDRPWALTVGQQIVVPTQRFLERF